MAYNIISIPANAATYTNGRGGHDIECIVVHYTAGTGSATENGRYFAGGNRNASAHYFIDTRDIVQSVPDADTAWAVGNWGANQRTLNIEVCSNGEDFTSGEIERLAWLVQTLMSRHGIDANHVIRHYDAYDRFKNLGGRWIDPHKRCPAPYTPNGGDPSGEKWAALHSTITGGEYDTEEDNTEEEVEKMAATGLGVIVNPSNAMTAGHPGGLYRITADHVYHYTNPDQPKADDILSKAMTGESVPRLDMSRYGTAPWFDRMVQARGGWDKVVDCPHFESD